MNGRILKFNVTDGGEDVDDLNGLSARLTWNRGPSDLSSGGGWMNMSAKTNTDNPIRMRQVTFTTPVPQALLQQAGERTVLGLDIEDADGNTIASRSIPIIIEPSRLNPRASEIADTLKDLHDTLDRAQTLVDTASLTLGTVTTLVPSKKATGSMTGTGWQRKLNLSIPCGSKISQLTATALDGETPTVSTSSDANGDMIVRLGLPRGKQGPQGPKGEPGDTGNVPIATANQAGLVKPGSGLGVFPDGTLYLREQSRLYSRKGYYGDPFEVGTVIAYKGMGMYYNPIVTFFPNTYHSSNTVQGPIELQVLPDKYQFANDTPETLYSYVTMLSSPTDLTFGVTWIGVKITPRQTDDQRHDRILLRPQRSHRNLQPVPGEGEHHGKALRVLALVHLPAGCHTGSVVMNAIGTHPLILIICAVIGIGAITTLVSWLLRRLDQRRDLERAIEASPTIRRLELEIYRQSLFLPTMSRMQHEHQLDAGKAYTEHGGNGAGHVRYQQLADDYRRRLNNDDWNYHTNP